MQPCLSKNPKYTFYTIKSSLTLAYNFVYKVLILFTNYEKIIFIFIVLAKPDTIWVVVRIWSGLVYGV